MQYKVFKIFEKQRIYTITLTEKCGFKKRFTGKEESKRALKRARFAIALTNFSERCSPCALFWIIERHSSCSLEKKKRRSLMLWIWSNVMVKYTIVKELAIFPQFRPNFFLILFFYLPRSSCCIRVMQSLDRRLTDHLEWKKY